MTQMHVTLCLLHHDMDEGRAWPAYESSLNNLNSIRMAIKHYIRMRKVDFTFLYYGKGRYQISAMQHNAILVPTY